MRRLPASILVVMAAVACSGQASGIGHAASSQLTPEVQQIRAAAASGDMVATAAKLAQLRRTVAELRQRGELADAAAAKVLAAAAEVEAGTGGGGAPAQAPFPPFPSAQIPTTSLQPRGGTGTTQPASKGDNKGKGGGKGGDGQGD